jgi:nitrogen regulatory protein P-II 1
MKVEVVVPDGFADRLVKTIADAASTGRHGAGMVFVSALEDASGSGQANTGSAPYDDDA